MEHNAFNRSRVPRFSAGESTFTQTDTADLVASILTILFGAVHFFAYSFQFASETERLLWRIASLITTTLPIFWTVLYALVLLDDMKAKWRLDLSEMSIHMISAVVVPIYLIGRTMLLVIAITSLRSLPHDAYETVRWTTFIPHI